MPVARQPLVPPSPPRAPDDMTAFGRMAAMRENVIGTWGQRAYEEDIIQGRFFGRSSFILNTPDAIRHVLVDNYENYTRTPAGHPRAAPGARRRTSDRRGPRLEASAPDAGAGLHAARGRDARAAHDRGDRRDHRKARGASNEPVDLREAMQRMTLEIAGRTMFSFGMDRHGADIARLRRWNMASGWRGRISSICCCRCPGRARRILPAPASASAGPHSSRC